MTGQISEGMTYADDGCRDARRGRSISGIPVVGELELAPGVYTGPRLSRGVRERVWRVLSDWHGELRRGAIVMTWRETTAAGGQGVLMLGATRRMLEDIDGVLLVRREL